MNVIDKIIELRNRVSKSIDEIDKERDYISSNYVNLKNYDVHGVTELENKIIDRLQKLTDEYDINMFAFVLATQREQNRLSELYLSHKMSREEEVIFSDPYKATAYTVICAATLVLNPVFDERLRSLKSARKTYYNINNKLVEISNLLENPKNEQDVERISILFNYIDFSYLDMDEDRKEKLKEQCIEYFKDELARIEKKKALERKEKEQALIEIKMKEVEEARIREGQKDETDDEEIFKSKINRFDDIQDVFDKWSFLFPDDFYTSEIKSRYNSISDLYQFSTFQYPDFDEEWYKTALISALDFYNSNYENDHYRNRVKYYIEYYSRQYELYLKISDIENLKTQIWSNIQVSDEESKVLASYDTLIAGITAKSNILTDEIDYKLLEMKEFLHEVKKASIIQNLTEEGKLPITSFIFFDYELDSETKERKAYVTSDLDPDSTRSLIDKSIQAGKIESNAYDDFCDLIDDLILYSKPRILLNSNFDRINKIIRKIYYTKNSHKSVNDSKENATDMVRIRPTLTSYARFVDERVEFTPGTTKFNQVKTLLESKYPSVSIDSEKPFSIFINYLDTFKRSAKENYNPSFERRKDSKIKDVLKSEETAFSDEDLRYLSEMIDFSMKTYSDLEKMNSLFDFSIINTIKKQVLK